MKKRMKRGGDVDMIKKKKKKEKGQRKKLTPRKILVSKTTRKSS